MDLENFAKPICAGNRFIKASFGGMAGSGKTYTASRFVIGAYKHLKCDKPILFIDNEKGGRFMVNFFQKDGVKTYVKETIELADVLEAFNFLEERKISFLFIDSLTKIWYKYINDYIKNNNKRFMTLQDWGKILPYWQKTFADKFVEVSGNVVFTGRGGYQYDYEENDNGKKEFVKSGVKMKVAGETPYEPDLNIWMSLEQKLDENEKPMIRRTAMIMKDRSDMIDGKTFINPTYDEFKPVVDYITSVKVGPVMGSTNTQNIAPKEEYDERRAKKTMLIEEINGQLEAAFPGTSKEMKIRKAAIKKHVFGTFSETSINHSTLETVETALSKIMGIITFNNCPEDGYNDMVKKVKSIK